MCVVISQLPNLVFSAPPDIFYTQALIRFQSSKFRSGKVYDLKKIQFIKNCLFIMNRSNIYFLSEGEKSTFTFDETLPALPLPDLEDTLNRYYESLKPFGSPDDLRNSQSVIDDFRLGVGSRLHKALKERAGKQKNWLGDWWENYGYHLLRVPLQPYTCMTMPACYEKLGIPETRENRLKVILIFIFVYFCVMIVLLDFG